MSVKIRATIAMTFAVTMLVAAPRAASQMYRVEKAAAPPPEALSAAVRDTLNPEVLRVMGPRGLVCEVWLRKAVPVAAATEEPDVKLTRIAEGTLVGAMRLPGDTRDFRQQVVHTGVYTLRYLWQPVTADHLGTAEQRDFVAAAPAAIDTNPASVVHDDAVKLSLKVTNTKHPSVWSLPPLAANAGTLPAMVRNEANDTWMLSFAATPAGGGAPLRMGLVVVGHAPEF